MNFRSTLPVFALVSALFFSSCSTENSTREFAEKYTAAEDAAWSTGDLATLEALEDPAVVYHMPGLELNGWKAHADYITQGRPKVSNLQQNWKYLSGEGNHFALAYDSSAIVKEDDKNPSMSLSNDFLFVVRLSNGKIAEVWMNGSTTSKPVTKD
jgi:ketosteroid isomerase-like protein